MGAISLPRNCHSDAEDLLLEHSGCEMLANHVMISRPWKKRTCQVPNIVHAIVAKEFPFFDTQEDGHTCRHSVDVLFFCGAGKSTTYHDENFSIGVEVKTTDTNLFCDSKIPSYFNRTDYFYLAVPDNLLLLGLMKASHWEHVGVVSLDTGKIYKPALRQYPTEHNRAIILERLLLEKNYSRVDATIHQDTHGLSTVTSLPKVDWSKGYPEFVKT